MSRKKSLLRRLPSTTSLVLFLLIISSCQGYLGRDPAPEEIHSQPGFEYQLGLGYGFLDKKVLVTIDGEEVLSMVGTEEIETFAQMQGTYMLVSGYSPNKEVTVQISVNGGQVVEQILDLSNGIFIHIYLEQEEIKIYNTPFLVFE